MAADAALLSSVPLFERLDEEERGLLAAQIEDVEFTAATTIFKRGDPGDAIFIVAAGEVEIYVEDTTGQRIVFETAKAGEFFGEAEAIPMRLIAHPGGAKLELPAVLRESIAIAIGPEGGFTESEAAAACTAGWQSIDLGTRILRIETAAVALIARIALS